ncbi:hypothetical protein FNV43_RR18571 [Rhamnella rubrinervis]|uniref:Uncharacterized protein n=1 Tax=Rhamnella rubrinervis TaxID=2594499 RepID=A0A8K0EB80_9ROSA|nr:hypothetical protein FNV43_RR18571 [Rhamnella rubrinervis]
MDAKLLHSLAATPPSQANLLAFQKSSTTERCQRFSPHVRRRALKLTPIFNKTTTSDGTDDVPDGNSALRSPITSPETVELRFRRRSSRKRSKQLREDGVGDGQFSKAQTVAPPPPVKKKWEDMNVAEKAIELYVGEKGILFWLNKFAYASIFIMIGAWILFRFVGPALNLYQLDSAPLSPTSIFKGS